VPSMPARAAAAAATVAAADLGTDEEIPEDSVVGTINELVAAGKIKNVIEDPRNTFIREKSTAPAASAEAKWMAEKMAGKQAGVTLTALVSSS